MLYELTNMTYSHKYIMNVLVNGEFKPNVGLQFVLDEWVKFRVKTVRRKFVYLVGKTLERLTIIGALIKANKNIDAIIALMKSSQSKEDAKQVLIQKYDFAEKEAEYIVTQQLYKLSGIETDKLKAELQEKKTISDGYISILSSESNIRAIIKEDLEALAAKYGKEKRKTVMADVERMTHIDLIEEEDLLVTITTDNYLYSTPVSELRDSNRGNKGTLIVESKRNKVVERSVRMSSHDELMCFTDKGKMFVLSGYELNVNHVHISNIIPELNGQKIVAFVPVREKAQGSLIFVTSSSFTKRCDLAEYRTRMPQGGLIAVALDDEETLVGVELSQTPEDDEIVITTSRGYASRIFVQLIPLVKRTTKGRRLIRLKEGDRCMSLVLTSDSENSNILFITTKGKGKMVPVSGLLLKKTETGMSAAFLAIKLNPEDQLCKTVAIAGDQQIVLTSSQGKSIKIGSEQVNTYGREAKGGKIMSLNGDDTVAAITVV
jgi:DNA gyrase subunit A